MSRVTVQPVSSNDCFIPKEIQQMYRTFVGVPNVKDFQKLINPPTNEECQYPFDPDEMFTRSIQVYRFKFRNNRSVSQKHFYTFLKMHNFESVYFGYSSVTRLYTQLWQLSNQIEQDQYKHINMNKHDLRRTLSQVLQFNGQPEKFCNSISNRFLKRLQCKLNIPLSYLIIDQLVSFLRFQFSAESKQHHEYFDRCDGRQATIRYDYGGDKFKKLFLVKQVKGTNIMFYKLQNYYIVKIGSECMVFLQKELEILKNVYNSTINWMLNCNIYRISQVSHQDNDEVQDKMFKLSSKCITKVCNIYRECGYYQEKSGWINKSFHVMHQQLQLDMARQVSLHVVDKTDLFQDIEALDPKALPLTNVIYNCDLDLRKKYELSKIHHIFPPPFITPDSLLNGYYERCHTAPKFKKSKLDDFLKFAKHYIFLKHCKYKKQRIPTFKDKEMTEEFSVDEFPEPESARIGHMDYRGYKREYYFEEQYDYVNYDDYWQFDAQDTSTTHQDLEKSQSVRQTFLSTGRESDNQEDELSRSSLDETMLKQQRFRDGKTIKQSRKLIYEGKRQTVINISGKHEHTKTGKKIREVGSHNLEARVAISSSEKNCNQLSRVLSGISHSQSQIQIDRQFTKCMKEQASQDQSGYFILNISMDISGFSPKMPRPLQRGMVNVIQSFFRGKEKGDIYNSMNDIMNIFDKQGHHITFPSPFGSMQGWWGSHDTVLHHCLIAYVLLKAKEAGLIDPHDSAQSYVLIDDAIIQVKIHPNKTMHGKALVNDQKKRADNFFQSLVDIFKDVGLEVDRVKTYVSTHSFIYLNRMFVGNQEVATSLKTISKATAVTTVGTSTRFQYAEDIFNTLKGSLNTGADPLQSFIFGTFLCMVNVSLSKKLSFLAKRMDYPFVLNCPLHFGGFGIPILPSWISSEEINQQQIFFEMGIKYQLNNGERSSHINSLMSKILSMKTKPICSDDLLQYPFDLVLNGFPEQKDPLRSIGKQRFLDKTQNVFMVQCVHAADKQKKELNQLLRTMKGEVDFLLLLALVENSFCAHMTAYLSKFSSWQYLRGRMKWREKQKTQLIVNNYKDDHLKFMQSVHKGGSKWNVKEKCTMPEILELYLAKRKSQFQNDDLVVYNVVAPSHHNYLACYQTNEKQSSYGYYDATLQIKFQDMVQVQLSETKTFFDKALGNSINVGYTNKMLNVKGHHKIRQDGKMYSSVVKTIFLLANAIKNNDNLGELANWARYYYCIPEQMQIPQLDLSTGSNMKRMTRVLNKQAHTSYGLAQYSAIVSLPKITTNLLIMGRDKMVNPASIIYSAKSELLIHSFCMYGYGGNSDMRDMTFGVGRQKKTQYLDSRSRTDVSFDVKSNPPIILRKIMGNLLNQQELSKQGDMYENLIDQLKNAEVNVFEEAEDAEQTYEVDFGVVPSFSEWLVQFKKDNPMKKQTYQHIYVQPSKTMKKDLVSETIQLQSGFKHALVIIQMLEKYKGLSVSIQFFKFLCSCSFRDNLFKDQKLLFDVTSDAWYSQTLQTKRQATHINKCISGYISREFSYNTLFQICKTVGINFDQKVTRIRTCKALLASFSEYPENYDHIRKWWLFSALNCRKIDLDGYRKLHSAIKVGTSHSDSIMSIYMQWVKEMKSKRDQFALESRNQYQNQKIKQRKQRKDEQNEAYQGYLSEYFDQQYTRIEQFLIEPSDASKKGVKHFIASTLLHLVRFRDKKDNQGIVSIHASMDLDVANFRLKKLLIKLNYMRVCRVVYNIKSEDEVEVEDSDGRKHVLQNRIELFTEWYSREAFGEPNFDNILHYIQQSIRTSDYMNNLIESRFKEVMKWFKQDSISGAHQAKFLQKAYDYKPEYVEVSERPNIQLVQNEDFKKSANQLQELNDQTIYNNTIMLKSYQSFHQQHKQCWDEIQQIKDDLNTERQTLIANYQFSQVKDEKALFYNQRNLESIEKELYNISQMKDLMKQKIQDEDKQIANLQEVQDEIYSISQTNYSNVDDLDSKGDVDFGRLELIKKKIKQNTQDDFNLNDPGYLESLQKEQIITIQRTPNIKNGLFEEIELLQVNIDIRKIQVQEELEAQQQLLIEEELQKAQQLEQEENDVKQTTYFDLDDDSDDGEETTVAFGFKQPVERGILYDTAYVQTIDLKNNINRFNWRMAIIGGLRNVLVTIDGVRFDNTQLKELQDYVIEGMQHDYDNPDGKLRLVVLTPTVPNISDTDPQFNEWLNDLLILKPHFQAEIQGVDLIGGDNI